MFAVPLIFGPIIWELSDRLFKATLGTKGFSDQVSCKQGVHSGSSSDMYIECDMSLPLWRSELSHSPSCNWNFTFQTDITSLYSWDCHGLPVENEINKKLGKPSQLLPVKDHSIALLSFGHLQALVLIVVWESFEEAISSCFCRYQGKRRCLEDGHWQLQRWVPIHCDAVIFFWQLFHHLSSSIRKIRRSSS